MFECVINISEGQRLEVLDELSCAAGASLRDRHRDDVHNRSVFTLINHYDDLRSDVREFIDAVTQRLDLRAHAGVHPRFGVLDVVPFVALDDEKALDALVLRDDTATWLAGTYAVPVFLYGDLRGGGSRTLPDVRRQAFGTLAPDFGPAQPDPRLGASAVGARDVLVAWNIWVRNLSLEDGKTIAREVRGPCVRTLAFRVNDYTQISCNLIEPLRVGPSWVYDRVQELLVEGVIDHAELVGLLPEAVLRNEDRDRWSQLGLSDDQTIESRLQG